jgi:hypothetical protein
MDPALTVPRIKEGLLYGSAVAEMGPDAGGLAADPMEKRLIERI